MNIILQNISSYETRAVQNAAMLLDDVHCLRSAIEDLTQHAAHLRQGAMPVGSVEFVRAAMSVAGFTEPVNMSYPPQALKFLRRQVQRRHAGEVIGHWFIKPVATKQFTGFVFDTMANPRHLNAHDREQYDLFMAMDPNEEVWVSEVVSFMGEWRYYIVDGRIVGSARYDPDGPDDICAPQEQEVLRCVQDLAIEHPYAIDFGVLTNGESALVEINDAWSIGLYAGALSARDYYAFLQQRWNNLFKQANNNG